MNHSIPSQGNGQVERMNRTLLSMLRTPPEEKKANWKDSLNKFIHAYNCLRQETTGFSPFYLMFGRSPRLPIDLLFDLDSSPQQGDYQDYVRTWQAGMKQAYDIASRNTMKSSARSKAYYDKKASAAVLCPGVIAYSLETCQKEEDLESFVHTGKSRYT